MSITTTYKSRTLPTVHAHGTRPLGQCPFLGLGLSPVAIVILGRPVAPGATVGVKPAPVDVEPDPFGPTRDHPTAFTLEAAVDGLTVGLVKAKHTLTDTEYRELLDKVSFHVWTEQMEMDQQGERLCHSCH